jgi:hypothetical protein
MTRARHVIAGILLSAAAGCGGSSHSSPDGATIDAAPDAFKSSVEAIPLTTPDSSYYNVTLMMGAGTFALDLDTGSTSVGVAGTTCTGCGVTPLYNASTGTDTHMTASTQYDDGTGWSGEIYSDSVSLGHATPAVKIDFVDITAQMDGFFDGSDYQGIMGLGPQQNAEDGTTAYVDAATAAGVPKIMAFELCPSHGNMWYGGFDPSAGSGDVQYATMLPIDDNNPYYAIDIDDMLVAGKSLGFTAPDFQEPVLDTGTSYAYLPTPVHDALVSAINMDPGFKSVFGSQTISDNDCVTKAGSTAATIDAALPLMSMKLSSASGDITISVPPSQSYLIDVGGGQWCLAFNDGGAQGGATFGDTFLRSYLTVIDTQGSRIGFAPDAGCAASGDSNARVKMTNPRYPRPHPRSPATLNRK